MSAQMKSDRDFFTKEEAESGEFDIPEDGSFVEHYLGCGAVFPRRYLYLRKCPSCGGELRYR